MTMSTLTRSEAPAKPFPALMIQNRLKAELQRIANENSVLRASWDPLLDSLRVVGTVLVLEDIFPFRLPPDLVVKKGGYQSVNEALDDMVGRLESLWSKGGKKKVLK